MNYLIFFNSKFEKYLPHETLPQVVQQQLGFIGGRSISAVYLVCVYLLPIHCGEILFCLTERISSWGCFEQ